MRTLTLLAMIGLLALSSGCPTTGSNPPPEAVLAGEWNAADENGKPYLFRFNSEGILVHATTTLPDGSQQSMNIIGSSSTVEGNSVTVWVPHPEEWSIFTGTFSENQNRIDGELVIDTEITQIVNENVVFTIPRGSFVLVRR